MWFAMHIFVQKKYTPPIEYQGRIYSTIFRLGNCFPPHITQQQKTLGITKTKKREKNAQNTLDT